MAPLIDASSLLPSLQQSVSRGSIPISVISSLAYPQPVGLGTGSSRGDMQKEHARLERFGSQARTPGGVAAQ